MAPRMTTTPPVMYSQPWAPTPFDDRRRAAVAHREPDARPTNQVQPATGRAVQAGIARDGEVGGPLEQDRVRPDDDLAAREALAHVVVGLADQLQGHVLVGERAEALAGRPGEAPADRSSDVGPLDEPGGMGAERALGGGDGRGDAQGIGVVAAHRVLDTGDRRILLDVRQVHVRVRQPGLGR